jgi:hypothetical protein
VSGATRGVYIVDRTAAAIARFEDFFYLKFLSNMHIYVLESLGHMYNCKLNLFDPETKMQSFVYQLFVLICIFFVSFQFNLCLVFFK